MVTTVFIANLLMDAWLLTVLYRRHVWKQLPWFVSYITWGFLSACVALATYPVSSRAYAGVYWWLEAVGVVMAVGAFRESFLIIFQGFTSKRGFRWSLRGVILGVLAYSAWKAMYAPPIETDRIASFILGAEFTFRWGIAAVGFLSLIHMHFLEEPLTGREPSVVTGLGVVSISFHSAIGSEGFHLPAAQGRAAVEAPFQQVECRQWGTVYHEDKDLARIDMANSQTSQPVEQFTISFVRRFSPSSIQSIKSSTSTPN